MSLEDGRTEITEAQACLAAEVVKFMPEAYAAVRFKASCLVPVSEFRFFGEVADGGVEPIAMNLRFNRRLISKVRDSMYREGTGTWFSGTFNVERSGRMEAHFNYDDEPEWDVPVDPIAYVTDQDKYPRDVEHQPGWLKAKLAEGLARRAEREK